MMRTTILAALLLLTACGGDGDADTSDPDQAGSTVPQCSEVWVDGKTLPEDYAGCETDDGLVVDMVYECADGREFIWNDEGYGFLGEQAHATPDVKGWENPELTAAHKACDPA